MGIASLISVTGSLDVTAEMHGPDLLTTPARLWLPCCWCLHDVAVYRTNEDLKCRNSVW